MLKASVVVPVFRTEKYLGRCLDSACNQTLSDIEIICVNDCTDDNSLSIVEKYAQNDHRMHIISHDRNHGLSAARNTGLDAATGEYVYFLDSDDWIDNDYVEKMVSAAQESNCAIIMNTNIIMEYEDGSRQWYEQKIGRNTVGELNINDHDLISHTTWAYLFKKSFLDTIKVRFPYALKHEDLYFQQVTFVHLDHIYLINTSTYHHSIRADSIMGCTNRAGYPSDRLAITEKIYEYFSANNLFGRMKVHFHWLRHHVSYFKDNEQAFISLQNLFVRIANEISAHQCLYKTDELQFLNIVITSTNSDNLYKSVVNHSEIIRINQLRKSAQILRKKIA